MSSFYSNSKTKKIINYLLEKNNGLIDHDNNVAALILYYSLFILVHNGLDGCIYDPVSNFKLAHSKQFRTNAP